MKQVKKQNTQMDLFAQHMHQRIKEGILITFVSLGSFLFLSLVTYHVSDPGWSHTGSYHNIQNLAGRTGAFFSDILLSLFGYMAYLLPAAIIYGGSQVYLQRGAGKASFLMWIIRFFGLLVALIGACGIATFHAKALGSHLPMTAGGILGQATKVAFVGVFNPIGSTLILGSAFLIGVTFFTGFSWLKLVDQLGRRGLFIIGRTKDGAHELSGVLVSKVKDRVGDLRKEWIESKARAQEDMLASEQQRYAKMSDTFTQMNQESAVVNEKGASKPLDKKTEETLSAHKLKVSIVESKAQVIKDANWDNAHKDADFDEIKAFLKGCNTISLPSVIDPKDESSSLNPTSDKKQPKEGFIGRFFGKNTNSVETSESAVISDFKEQFEKVELKDNKDASDPKEFKATKSFVKSSLASASSSGSLKEGKESNKGLVGNDGLDLEEITVHQPSLSLLQSADPSMGSGYSDVELEALSKMVEQRLAEFGVEVNVVGVLPGPVITRFEMELAAGVKVSKIVGLAKDLARSLLVISVRVVEVIPGKSVVGLEIPNVNRAIIRLREILDSDPYQQSSSPLTIALGKDIAGVPVVADLARMPHLLVAGTTGSGKSVGLNAMLLSILYKATPQDVRMILIDPKMLELAAYEGIPHLLAPVVTDMKDAANALKWCVAEMDRRYQLMAAVGVRNLAGYNHKVTSAAENGQPIIDPFWKLNLEEEAPILEKLPYIVVLVDEFADMIMVVGKKVEELIARIAQKARAAGIHLILATQRPSVDVITGLIKANIPSRISFQVSSRIDSRTILDQQGAEQLLGHGDMLYLPPGAGIPVRIHGCFVADDEVHKVVGDLKQTPPCYEEALVGSVLSGGGFSFDGEEGGDRDELYDTAVAIVVETRRASISNIQRRLKIGYNRAARIIEQMEEDGIVSPVQSNGSREVLAPAPYGG